MASSGNTGARPGMAWPQMLALAFGVVYLLVGIVGFFITGFDGFTSNRTADGNTDTLLFFMINPLHNVVHIVIGLAGIALSRTLAGARTYGWLLAVGYAAAFVYGLIAVNEEWDFLNINQADNVLHIATAIVGLVIALGPVNDRVARPSRA
ncbi:DUF4383 domain-containing protein [Geodermatophilus normandii]|uniref:DUF4383 domain-containing protein n=1 Tax=Geodermatophilus normandii TaxID=1137989 RepID=A0A6P0GL54_9ACTN|nr:DUF4383 domain-containing protein [Geodermatophilus normandii]NEM08067.1 DUF4383 domain-containing protein [Geodermatophilus normandii]